MSKKTNKKLSTEAKKLWDRLNEKYQLSDVQQFILRTALQCFDDFEEAREVIKRDQYSMSANKGTYKKHPAIEAQKAAQSGMLQAFRLLNIDLKEPMKRQPKKPEGMEKFFP